MAEMSRQTSGMEEEEPTRRAGMKTMKINPLSLQGKGLTDEDRLALHRRARTMDADAREMIRQGIKQNRVCGLLRDCDIDTLLQKMQYFEFKEDERVVTQGENGSTFFIVHEGTLEVSVDGEARNTLRCGDAFGGIALVYQCPRTATVTSVTSASCWGANGRAFKRVLQENAQRQYSENRKFLDSITLFDGLSNKQKKCVADVLICESFEVGARVITEGEPATAIYFVKKGDLRVLSGGKVTPQGELVSATETGRIGPSGVIGDDALVNAKPYGYSVVADGKCEIVCIGDKDLKEVLGGDLGACLERIFLLSGIKQSPVMSQFSNAQQQAIVAAMAVQQLGPGQRVDTGLRFVLVVEGELVGTSDGKEVTMARGQWYEEDEIEGAGGGAGPSQKTASSKGCRLGILQKERYASALKALGLSSTDNAEKAIDYTRRMYVIKKVPIFQHLSEEQTGRLVKSFSMRKYSKGEFVIKQGDIGTSFFVIASGELQVFIDGAHKRNLSKNACFGERALLFDEPRTASVEVTSSDAEIWSVEKTAFAQIVKGNMQKQLEQRIKLQDTTVTLKDLKHMKVIGVGGAGMVRLVEHKATRMRYALKRIRKTNGSVPPEVERECSLLGENDHPFVMHLVQTFKTDSSVYVLTELITGGELHAAIRKIPRCLFRAEAQFYTGSLVLVLEALAERNIVYRDLKPENVMLDQQGYLKLVDFGIAKKLEDNGQTFTVVGTPHYMAPELLLGRGYGVEVDVWSLGILQFEFVCGFLPFGDDYDDPMLICKAVLKESLKIPPKYRDTAGRALMTELLRRKPKARLGAGIHGYEGIKGHAFFQAGHANTSVFDKILGRELTPPYIPEGEQYSDDVADATFSDSKEFAA